MMISIMNEKEAKELYLFHDLQALNIIGKTEFDYFFAPWVSVRNGITIYCASFMCKAIHIFFGINKKLEGKYFFGKVHLKLHLVVGSSSSCGV